MLDGRFEQASERLERASEERLVRTEIEAEALEASEHAFLES